MNRLRSFTDALSLVAYDDTDTGGIELAGSAHYVRDERRTSQPVKYLGAGALHSRAQAGSQYEHADRFIHGFLQKLSVLIIDVENRSTQLDGIVANEARVGCERKADESAGAWVA